MTRSPAVAPPLFVPLSLPVSVPHSLSLSLAAGAATVTFTLPFTLTPAAHHRLRPPQEVVHTHVVVVRAGGEGAVLRRSLLVSEARGRSLMWLQGGVVVVMVGLVRWGWGVAVMVVGGVVGGRLLHTGVRRQSLPGSRRPNAVVVIPHVVVVGPVEENIAPHTGEASVHRLVPQVLDEACSLVEVGRTVGSWSLPAVEVVLFRATPT